jgi:ATP-binding cassette, subfamily B, bacterial
MKKILIVLLVIFFFSCKSKKDEEFPLYVQQNSRDCGPTCLKMIFEFYDKKIPLDSINEVAKLDKIEGTNLLDLSEAVEHFGFKSLGVKFDYERLKEAPLPAILFWNNNHFVVLYKIENDVMYVADPDLGRKKYSKNEFCIHWCQKSMTDEKIGIALLIDKLKK